VFEEQGCRFVIDLPEGWDLEPQKKDAEYVFKGGGSDMVVIEYVYEENDVARLFKKAVSSFRQAGAPDAEPDGAIKDLKVNTHPGRWGFYKGVHSDEDRQRLNAALGAVALKEGGVIFVSILNDASRNKLEKVIERSFQTIRECRQTVTGVAGAKSVVMDTADSQPTEFKHEFFSLTLPPGWAAQRLPQNVGKEVVGSFTSDRIADGSVLAMCMRGYMATQPAVMQAITQSVVPSSMPGAQKINSYEVKLGGEKVPVSVYSGGTRVEEGNEVAMEAVTVTKKAGQCGLALLGYSQAVVRPALEKDILSMIRNAR
jgi:hypothetical protein